MKFGGGMEEQFTNLKPIFYGIFGKQKNIVYEKPKFAERKIADMLKELSKISLLDWIGMLFQEIL